MDDGGDVRGGGGGWQVPLKPSIGERAHSLPTVRIGAFYVFVGG